MDILTIKGLKKSFGNKEVLRGLDLSVGENRIFGFVGRNGAGKTTTMKAVLGLLRIDEGEIEVAGERVRFGETPTNKYIGYLPDVPEFYPFMTAREYLRLLGESLEMSKDEIEERSERLLKLVGLANENSKIKGYSRGMKQRLGIAQALIGRPKLIICDEPTSALDPVGRREILDVLLAASEESTVLFSTHILSDVERICTDVAFLEGGRIVKQGTISELRAERMSDEFTISLDSDKDVSRATDIDCRLKLGDGASVTVKATQAEIVEIMQKLTEEGIPVRKIERIEPTLESLFMEVVK